MNTTWSKLIIREMLAQDVYNQHHTVMVAPNEKVLDVEFDNDYGLPGGPQFLLWTTSRVYFPVVYDGAEWVGSAPRDPQPDGQPHVGGE